MRQMLWISQFTKGNVDAVVRESFTVAAAVLRDSNGNFNHIYRGANRAKHYLTLWVTSESLLVLCSRALMIETKYLQQFLRFELFPDWSLRQTFPYSILAVWTESHSHSNVKFFNKIAHMDNI